MKTILPASKFNVGQIVKYANPQGDIETKARFIVKEITAPMEIVNGKPEHGILEEKLTVEFICDMRFRPVSCFFSKEFIQA